MEVEDIVEAVEEVDEAEVDTAVVRSLKDPTISVLLSRRACVVWRAMRLRMPPT